MTDIKPYGYAFFSMWSGKDAFSFTKPDPSVGREVTPLYRHPPAPQPDADPAVEAARRKALRAIFAALDWHHGCSDGHAVHLSAAILRDLVGLPRQGATGVPFYDNDGPPGPHPAFGEKGDRAPARLTAGQIEQVIASAAHPGHTSAMSNRAARAVHAAVYGKGV